MRDKKKLTNKEALDIIEMKGLDYTAIEYLICENFEDPMFKLFIVNVWDSLELFEKYLTKIEKDLDQNEL